MDTGSPKAAVVEKPPRVASINETDKNKEKQFANNMIFTAKYGNPISFFCLTIFEQFRRIANLYFLVISLLMVCGIKNPTWWYSPVSYETTLGPLCVVIMLTMVRTLSFYHICVCEICGYCIVSLLGLSRPHHTSSPFYQQGWERMYTLDNKSH